MNTKIFQIYYKPELLQHCDTAFEPLDNTANTRPELREWHVWDQYHEQRMASGLGLWGYVSWKFQEKTGLAGQTVLDWIAANPGHDVYLINPCIVNEAVFANCWEQGDYYHPNISDIGNRFLQKLGYTDVDVRGILLDRNRTVYTNYVVGTPEFWDKFMTFSRRLFTEADQDGEFENLVFGQGLSNYAHDSTLPNFTFLIERLLPTFIELENIRCLAYRHTKASVLPKYRQVFAAVQALSDLKVEINRHQSDELYDVWNYFRQDFLNRHPGVLNLE